MHATRIFGELYIYRVISLSAFPFTVLGTNIDVSLFAVLSCHKVSRCLKVSQNMVSVAQWVEGWYGTPEALGSSPG